MQANKGLVEDFGKINRFPPGQQMLGRNHQHQPVTPVRLGFQPAQTGFGRHHANFHQPGRNRLNNRRARLFFQIDPEARVLTQEIAKIFRQETVDRIGVGEHGDLAIQAAGVGRQIGVHLFELGEDLAGMAEQGFTGRGRGQAARVTGKERHAERRLKLGQTMAGRGRREMNARRSPGQAAAVGNRRNES